MANNEIGIAQEDDSEGMASPQEGKEQLSSEEERELIREMIRKRRQHDWASRAIFYPAKPKPSIMDKETKDVSAYARVSTLSKDQTSSIENQTQYYTEKISKNPNWNLQKIYTDEGKSGTSMRHREAFKQMLADAADKKMDLILCASVSRFARNVSDCIDQVIKLRTMNPSHPVGVYFETENIYTLDPDSDQSLQVHALLADWESANKSRRMILSYDQRICTGQYPVLDLLGFRHTKDGDLIIEPEEAKTVRFIFLSLLLGHSPEEVAEILTEKERPTLRGRTEWNAAMVKNITTNERRWGDLQARKTIVIDYKAGKVAKNNNDRDAAFIPSHHEGIVSREIANAMRFVVTSSRQVTRISELTVIEDGRLRGFVSVSPGWSGIDRETFIHACKCAYSKAEWAQIEEDVNSYSRDDPKLLSLALPGYEVPRGVFFMGRDTPALTLSTKSMSFNQACHTRMGDCEYIEVLYHPILQTLIIRESEEDNPNAVRWVNDDGKPITAISSKAYSNSIYEEMGWIRGYRFRFRGIARERGGAHIIFFHLEEPRILTGKQRQTSGSGEATDATPPATIRYVPYRIDDGATVSSGPHGYAYPEEWMNGSIGVSVALRRQRDALTHNIAEPDILQRGTTITNPMIGELPAMDEVQEELEQLLMTM